LKSNSDQPITTEIEQGVVGIVGAISINADGHMVSCTLTGGITGKMAGRVGDTPIPGAGGYCDNRVGTISTTVHRDSIMRYCLDQKIIQMLENGEDPEIATDKACVGTSESVGGSAGSIVISKEKKIGIGFSSPKMAWAYLEEGIIYYGITKNQFFTSHL